MKINVSCYMIKLDFWPWSPRWKWFPRAINEEFGFCEGSNFDHSHRNETSPFTGQELPFSLWWSALRLTTAHLSYLSDLPSVESSRCCRSSQITVCGMTVHTAARLTLITIDWMGLDWLHDDRPSMPVINPVLCEFALTITRFLYKYNSWALLLLCMLTVWLDLALTLTLAYGENSARLRSQNSEVENNLQFKVVTVIVTLLIIYC